MVVIDEATQSIEPSTLIPLVRLVLLPAQQLLATLSCPCQAHRAHPVENSLLLLVSWVGL